MNKTIIIFWFLTILCAGTLSAQSPPHINYQAALRNPETGVELSNQKVFMVVKFLNGGPAGDIVYQEEHDNVNTSLYGLINIQLGAGEALQGNFSNIPWSSGNIWLELEIDAGKGLQSVGATKFSSVPYALYAADAPQPEPDGDGDSTNEIQDLIFEDHVLTISLHDNPTPIDLSQYVNVPDEDSDPTNEIQDLSITGNTLKITGNPQATDIDLTPYVNVPDGDSDPTNELITAFGFDPVTAMISITEGGITHTQDLSTLAGGNGPDGDADPTNEIQDLVLNGNILKITDNPDATEINLSPYVNIPNLDNDPTNEIQDLILTGNNLKLSGNPSATNINLGAYKQDLSLTGNILKITGNSAATNINLSPYVNVPNLDNDPTNEIQDLILTGNNLKLSGNPSATNINLGAYKQDLSLTGNILKITGNASATNINLSPYVNVPNLDNDPTNEIQDLSLTGTTLKITGNPSATEIDLSTYKNVPNLDNDPTNEIQDLILTGNNLKLSGNPSATNINLGAYKQDLSLTGNILKITGNASATNINLSPYVNVPNLDNDPTNEIQDLILTGNNLKLSGNPSATNINLGAYQQDLSLTGNVLKITGNASATSINLSPYVNVPNLDNDPTNEIQDLILSGNNLKISGNSSATNINLGAYQQDLSLSGNVLKITGNASATSINLSPYVNVPNLDNDPTNEIQDLSLTGTTLKITGNPSASEIDLSSYKNVPNLDNDPTNEIQDLILSGNNLKISGNSSATNINLGAYQQDLTLTGNILKITGNSSATNINLTPYVNIPNLDNDPTNEIQDLNLNGNTLKITGNSSATNIDLSQYQNQALPEGQIFVGNSSSVATPRSVSGDLSMTSSGAITVGGLKNIPISNTSPTNGQKLAYNAGTNMWEPVSDGTGAPVTKYYAVDPMDFVELNNPNGDDKLNVNNGLKYFDLNAPFAMLRKEKIRTIAAPVHLPHGAVITNITFYVRAKGSGQLSLSFKRKQLTNYSTGNTNLASGTSGSINGNGSVPFTINSNNLVDNQLYTYRVFVTFTKVLNEDDEEDWDDVEQAIYGCVITYTE